MRFPPHGFFTLFLKYISMACDFCTFILWIFQAFKNNMHKEIRNSDIKKLVGDRLKDETVFFFTFLLSSNMFEYIFSTTMNKKYSWSVENYEFRLSKLSTTFFLMCYCYMQILTVLNACYMSASLFIYEYFIWLISNKLQQYCWSLGLF